MNQAEFLSKSGTLLSHSTSKGDQFTVVVTLKYEKGEAKFDGSKWAYSLTTPKN